MTKESLIAPATTALGVFASNAFIVIGMSFTEEYGAGGAGMSAAGFGAMAMGGAVTVVGSGVSTTVHDVSLLKSYRLIKQAEVGFGNALSNSPKISPMN